LLLTKDINGVYINVFIHKRKVTLSYIVIFSLFIDSPAMDRIVFLFDSLEKAAKVQGLIQDSIKNYPVHHFDESGDINGVKAGDYILIGNDIEAARNAYVSKLPLPEYIKKFEIKIILDKMARFDCDIYITEEVLDIR
jgi:hypothetical protein